MDAGRFAHYEVIERVASGGMGDVYRARDTSLGRDVALKFLSRAGERNAEARERLLREARAASSLDHPNVCTVHEVGETDEGELFIVMAFCSGRTLQQRMRDEQVPLEQAIDLARQIADGTAAPSRSTVSSTRAVSATSGTSP